MKDKSMCKVVVGVIVTRGYVGSSVTYHRKHDGKHLGAYFDLNARDGVGRDAGTVLDALCAAALSGLPEGRTTIVPNVYPNQIEACWSGEAGDRHFDVLFGFGEGEWVVSFGYEDVPVVLARGVMPKPQLREPHPLRHTP